MEEDMEKMKEGIRNHPCFSQEDPLEPGLLRLQVAPACNMRCSYCVRAPGRQDGSRTDSITGVPTPEEAVERVAAWIDGNKPLYVVELAGPGEPLANASTYVVLRKIGWLYPDVNLSVWTNGLLLPDRLDEIVKAGARSLTVSLNAISPETAEQIYEWILYRGRRYSGSEAADLLLNQQWMGLINAIEAGLAVTVYTVRIPGVNEDDIPLVEKRAEALGADKMMILPLTP
jgi:nitrogen fixation protein NifB